MLIKLENKHQVLRCNLPAQLVYSEQLIVTDPSKSTYRCLSAEQHYKKSKMTEKQELIPHP